jgi:Zn-dependent protease
MEKERKVYTSFHDIPIRDYMYIPKGSVEVGRPGKFSRLELTHLLISMTVLTIAFTFVLTSNNLITVMFGAASGASGFTPELIPNGLALSFIGIAIAFVFHELSHKFMAQRHGLWAEYRMFPQGLYLALFLGILTPFVFAAPGAVMFRGGSRKHETGQIALAGPLANIVIAAIFLPLYFFVFFESQFSQLIGFICLINAFLATFNLLPFGPLDGVKIIRWNTTVWVLTFIVSITVMMTIFTRFSFEL